MTSGEFDHPGERAVTLRETRHLVADASDRIATALTKKLETHGDRLWSRHECYGVLAEEVDELLEALRSHDCYTASDPMPEELVDVAVACIWGLVSIENETRVRLAATQIGEMDREPA